MRKSLYILGAFALVASLAALFSISGKRAPYRFLQNAELVSEDLYGKDRKTGEPMAHQIVFNIKGEYDSLIGEIKKELAADGWAASTRISPGFTIRSSRFPAPKGERFTKRTSKPKKRATYTMSYGVGTVGGAPPPVFLIAGSEAYISVTPGKAKKWDPSEPFRPEFLKEPWVTVTIFQPYEDKAWMEKFLLKLQGRAKGKETWPRVITFSAPASWEEARVMSGDKAKL